MTADADVRDPPLADDPLQQAFLLVAGMADGLEVGPFARFKGTKLPGEAEGRGAANGCHVQEIGR
jgi:hypothetical protein